MIIGPPPAGGQSVFDQAERGSEEIRRQEENTGKVMRRGRITCPFKAGKVNADFSAVVKTRLMTQAGRRSGLNSWSAVLLVNFYFYSIFL